MVQACVYYIPHYAYGSFAVVRDYFVSVIIFLIEGCHFIRTIFIFFTFIIVLRYLYINSNKHTTIIEIEYGYI